MKKILAILIVALLAVLLVFMLLGRRHEEPPVAQTTAAAGKEEPPVYRDQPHQGLATVHCALEVNGARCRSLGSGVPLYVKCIVTNPLDDQALDISEFHQLRPSFTPTAGTVSAPGMTLANPVPDQAPAHGTAVITWVLDGPLPPGSYDVSLMPPPGFAHRPDLGRVRVKPALLTVTDEPSPRNEIAYFQRQIMAVRGENEAIIAQVRTELLEHPESLSLRRELVDTLERTGDFPAARGELIQLGLLTQERQQGGNEDAPLHLPAWIITRDRMLQERIAAEQ